MKICILSTDQERDDNGLAEAARRKGHTASILNIKDMSLVITKDKPLVFWTDQNVTDAFDAVIPRLNVSSCDFGINILQQFICNHTYVSETPDALRLGRDKLKCMQYLLAQGVPFPTTCIAYKPEGFIPLAEHTGMPSIVKLIDSTEGTGIFVVRNNKELDNVAKTFDRFGASYVTQSFVQEAAGSDVRAFVVGGTVVAAMGRKAQDGDFRANVSLGAISVVEELSDEETQMVLEATNAIGINIAGVDFIRSKEGPLLLEINVSPDFTGEQGIENVTGCDVAGAIIDFTVQQTEPFYSNHRLLQLCSSEKE